MKVRCLIATSLLALAVVTVVGCGGNASSDNEAPIILHANITQGPADVDISVPADVTIGQMTINSQAVSPGEVLSQQQDAILTHWVVTPVRTDGGTVASPQWENDYTVYVPAGGNASLQNFRIFPSDYFGVQPLVQLYPANGGVDQATGRSCIRQALNITIYGTTVAGRPTSCSFTVNLNFFYVTQCQ